MRIERGGGEEVMAGNVMSDHQCLQKVRCWQEEEAGLLAGVL